MEPLRLSAHYHDVFLYFALPRRSPCWLCFVSIRSDAQTEKEEKRQKNMAKARQFDAGFQRELELRRKELEEEERAGR